MASQPSPQCIRLRQTGFFRPLVLAALFFLGALSISLPPQLTSANSTQKKAAPKKTSPASASTQASDQQPKTDTPIEVKTDLKPAKGRQVTRRIMGGTGTPPPPFTRLVPQQEPLRPRVMPDGSMVGNPTTGSPGITESVADIMARERRMALTRTPTPRLYIEREARPGNLPSDPRAPAVSSWPPSPRTMQRDDTTDQSDRPTDRPIVPLAPQTVSSPNYTAVTLADTLAFPPDTMGAAGPSQFIVAVNGRIRSFSKATGTADGALNADMDVFFNSVMTPPAANNFTSDPRIRYDRFTNRWFVIMIDVPGQTGNQANRVMVAVSDGPTITSSSNFTFFFFQMSTTNFTDYPTLGIDQNALYIGANMFSLSGSFQGCDVAVVRKSSILGAGPIVFTVFPGVVPSPTSDGPYTPQGVDNHDSGATEGYFVGVSNAFFSLLILRRVSNPAGTPSLSTNLTVTVPQTSFPLGVPSLGGNTNLDAIDDRLFDAQIRNGRLWTSHNIATTAAGVGATGGANRRTSTRWYELENLSTTPSLRQSGTVFDSTTAATQSLRYWIPSIMVSGQGHVAIGFSVAGNQVRINAGTVGRLANDALGTTQGTPVLFTNSTTAYAPTIGGNPVNRWGDYSYMSLDPCDDMTIWAVQQFCNATNSYGVQVARLLAPAPTITPCGTPVDVAQGTSNVNLNITGTGFYDPPASLSCRIPISATVSGTGVTVNSVTFNTPTSVTVNISVSGTAPTGTRTITITNPDGQQVSTSSCLNITPGATTTVTSINRASGDPTCVGTTVSWTVTFSDPVSGVTAGNFTLVGGTGASITTVSGSGTTWTVNANSGTAPGSLRLDMVNSTGITPAVSNVPFTGQSFTLNGASNVNSQVSLVVTTSTLDNPSQCSSNGYAQDLVLTAVLTNTSASTLLNLAFQVVELQESGGPPPSLPFRLLTADGATCTSGGLVGAIQSSVASLGPGASTTVTFRIALPSVRRLRFFVNVLGCPLGGTQLVERNNGLTASSQPIEITIDQMGQVQMAPAQGTSSQTPRTTNGSAMDRTGWRRR